jgi:hypothetical protein
MDRVEAIARSSDAASGARRRRRRRWPRPTLNSIRMSAAIRISPVHCARFVIICMDSRQCVLRNETDRSFYARSVEKTLCLNKLPAERIAHPTSKVNKL